MINYRVRRRMHAVVGLPDRHGHHVTWGSPANPDFKEMGEERYNHKSTPLLAMHCGSRGSDEKSGDRHKS